MEPFIEDLKWMSTHNPDFRHVLYTTEHSQIVAMLLEPGEDIERERHDGDQVFVLTDGVARFFIDGNVRDVTSGGIVVVPAGSWHRVVNVGEGPLRLITVYAPPQHPAKTVHRTRAEALRAELQPA